MYSFNNLMIHLEVAEQLLFWGLEACINFFRIENEFHNSIIKSSYVYLYMAKCWVFGMQWHSAFSSSMPSVFGIGRFTACRQYSAFRAMYMCNCTYYYFLLTKTILWNLAFELILMAWHGDDMTLTYIQC